MKRIAVIGLVGLASIISFTAGVGLATEYIEHRFDDRLRSENAYWTSTLDREVSIGELKTDAQAWVQLQVPAGRANFDPVERKFIGVVDNIHEPIGYPCSDWDLVVEITIGTDDRVTARRVTTSGACI